MSTYTLNLINQAINAINNKAFYINLSVGENSSKGAVEKAISEAEILQTTLDALQFYKENGLGENIDERV